MTTVEIKINRCGDTVGTVGWLARKATSIHIGEPNTGSVAAWLHDANGKMITCLAIRGYWDRSSPEITTLDRNIRDALCIGAAIPWTDAGWEAVSRLAEIAVAAIESKLERDDDAKMPQARVT